MKKPKKPSIQPIDKSQEFALLEQVWSASSVPLYTEKHHERFWHSFAQHFPETEWIETEETNSNTKERIDWTSLEEPMYTTKQKKRFWQAFERELGAEERRRQRWATIKSWSKRLFEPQTGWMSYAVVGVFAILLLSSTEPLKTRPAYQPATTKQQNNPAPLRKNTTSPKRQIKQRSETIKAPEKESFYKNLSLFQNFELFEKMAQEKKLTKTP